MQFHLLGDACKGLSAGIGLCKQIKLGFGGGNR